MAFTTYTLSGNVADLIGVDLTPGKIVLYLSPSVSVFTDGATEVRVGDIAAVVEDDGDFTISGIPSSTTTLISYKATVRWQSADGGRPAPMVSGWFNVTANAAFAAKWTESVTLTPVDAAVVANITAAAALGATNNTATASFITGAGATQTAFDARVAARIVADVPTASTTTAGRVELATTAETLTGTSTTLAVTPVAAGQVFMPVITPEKHGAVGDGVADDTAAVVAAFAEATALRVVGLGGNIWHPGATVQLRGTYKLTTLASRIIASCNIISDGATLVVPNAYAATALFVGHETSGYVLHSADMVLPNVIKSGATSLPAGGVGVQLQNLHHSKVRIARTTHHETGLWFTALGSGNCYNEYFMGWVDLCKVSWKLSIQTAGWVNQNTFIAGGITQSPNVYGGAATRRSGWRHILLDGGAGDTVHANTFVGISLEGDYSEYAIEFKNAAENVFIGNNRFEQGTAGKSVIVDVGTNVLAAIAHGFAVGDKVVFICDVDPAPLVSGAVYYVNAVGDTESFTVALTSGGATVNITTTGTNVKLYRPPVIHFDNSSGFTRDNVIYDYNNWPGRELQINRTGAAAPARKAAIVG